MAKKNIISKTNKKSDNSSKKNEITYWIVSETAFYGFFYYIQYLLKIEGNLWISSLALWVLINISIIFCPVVRKCYK